MYKFWEKIFDLKRWFFLILVLISTYYAVFTILYLQFVAQVGDILAPIVFATGNYTRWDIYLAILAAWVGVYCYDRHFYPKPLGYKSDAQKSHEALAEKMRK